MLLTGSEAAWRRLMLWLHRFGDSSRRARFISVYNFPLHKINPPKGGYVFDLISEFGGAKGSRTPDLLNAIYLGDKPEQHVILRFITPLYN
jgi:hypothetical protein